jgi:hypothetical protein
MFSRIVVWNRNGTCPTIAYMRVQSPSRRSRRSRPSTATRPEPQSMKRAIRSIAVVLPAPEGPTSASVSPGRTSSERPSIAGRD